MDLNWDDYLGRLAAFVVAQLRNDADLREIAGSVQLHATPTTPTVQQAVDECMRRSRSMVYEDWAETTLWHVKQLMSGRPRLVADAIALFADVPALKRDAAHAGEARREAHDAMYGEADDDALYDDDPIDLDLRRGAAADAQYCDTRFSDDVMIAGSTDWVVCGNDLTCRFNYATMKTGQGNLLTGEFAVTFAEGSDKVVGVRVHPEAVRKQHTEALAA